MMEHEKNKSHNFDVNTAGKEPPTPQPNIGKASMKDRYHIHGFFKEDRMPDGNHFPVTHEMDKHVETYADILDSLAKFLASYTPKFCNGLSIGIVEEPTLVD